MLIDVGTSIISGFVIFSALGFMATNIGKKVSDVAKSGKLVNSISCNHKIQYVFTSALYTSKAGIGI